MDVSGAKVSGVDALVVAVSTFKDDGLDIDALGSACDSEEGERGGDTLGVDMAGVDDCTFDAVAIRGEDRSGVDVVEVNAAGADTPRFEGEIGDSCAGVDSFVFEGDKQDVLVVPASLAAEERPSL